MATLYYYDAMWRLLEEHARGDFGLDGTIDFDDYSRVLANYGQGTPEGTLSFQTVNNTIGYAGYHFDPATGMSLARHRWLEHDLGRWMTRDPLVAAMLSSQGSEAPPYPLDTVTPERLGLYRYARSSPIIRIDPTGLICCIAMRCNKMWHGFSHCGLVFTDNNGTWMYDGSGGNTHTPIIRPWNPNAPGTVGPSNCNFPDSTCACLRNEQQRWLQLNIPRDTGCANSNWHVKCVTSRCGISVLWGIQGNRGKPSGWDCKGYKCGYEEIPGDPCGELGWQRRPRLVTKRCPCP